MPTAPTPAGAIPLPAARTLGASLVGSAPPSTPCSKAHLTSVVHRVVDGAILILGVVMAAIALGAQAVVYHTRILQTRGVVLLVVGNDPGGGVHSSPSGTPPTAPTVASAPPVTGPVSAVTSVVCVPPGLAAIASLCLVPLGSGLGGAAASPGGWRGGFDWVLVLHLGLHGGVWKAEIRFLLQAAPKALTEVHLGGTSNTMPTSVYINVIIMLHSFNSVSAQGRAAGHFLFDIPFLLKGFHI